MAGKNKLDITMRRKALIATLADLWAEHKRLDNMRWSSVHRDMRTAVKYEIDDIIETLTRLS